MRLVISILLISLLISLSAADESEGIQITDGLGREVNVPVDVQRVVCLNPDGTRIMVALGAADKIVGVGSYSKSCIILRETYPGLDDVEDVGNPYQGTLSLEKLAELDPDLVLVGGSVPDIADKIQEELKIPSICLYLKVADLEDFLETIDIVGRAIGEDERASELEEYMERKINEITNAASCIPESERTRVLVVGPPMTDDPLRVMVTQLALGYAGGINVAQSSSYKGGNPWRAVSLEQIANWDPDIIMIYGMSLLSPEDLLNNPDWKELKAIQGDQVYKIMTAWVGYDPSLLVVSTLQMANIMYPDEFDFDFQEEADKVFEEIYGVDGLCSVLETKFGISKV
jgi:iron complex transport system substrate-binding protein